MYSKQYVYQNCGTLEDTLEARTQETGDMDQTLAAERTAAEAALAGWRRMLAKAVHPREGEVAPSAVQERLKSLDAAWTRFDQAHSRYLNILNTVSVKWVTIHLCKLSTSGSWLAAPKCPSLSGRLSRPAGRRVASDIINICNAKK